MLGLYSILLYRIFFISVEVLVFYGCCNEFPQTGWFKTAEKYSLMILETRSLKWVLLVWNQGVTRAILWERICPLLLLASCGWWHSGLWPYRPNLQGQHLCSIFSSASNFPLLPLIRIGPTYTIQYNLPPNTVTCPHLFFAI